MSTAHVHTDQGIYELVQAIDGDWLGVLEGTDWVHAQYGRPYVKLRDDGQLTSSGVVRQFFVTYDGVRHDAGAFRNIT